MDKMSVDSVGHAKSSIAFVDVAGLVNSSFEQIVGSQNESLFLQANLNSREAMRSLIEKVRIFIHDRILIYLNPGYYFPD
jgi:hypothetical protein